MPNSVLASLDHVMRSRDPSVEQRRAKRDLVDLVSHVTVRDRTQGVRIINISPLGLMCRSDDSLLPGDRIAIWLPVVKDYPAEIRWAEDGRVGMEFLTPVNPRLYDAMMALIPPRQTIW
jgi:hypothetical protein